jgi:hypothetical protein
MSVNSPKKSVNTYTIPVDNKLQEFTVSVTGKAPEIKLWAPGQGKISVTGKAPDIKHRYLWTGPSVLVQLILQNPEPKTQYNF